MLQSSKSEVGNYSLRPNYSKFEFFNIPGKELNINNIPKQMLRTFRNKDYKFISILLTPPSKKNFNWTSSDPT